MVQKPNLLYLRDALIALAAALCQQSVYMYHLFLLQKLQELQGKSAVVSNLGTLQDDESPDKQQWKKTQRELQGMKAKIEQQVHEHRCGCELCNISSLACRI